LGGLLGFVMGILLILSLLLSWGLCFVINGYRLLDDCIFVLKVLSRIDGPVASRIVKSNLIILWNYFSILF